jgi:hypothetical protein
MTKKARERRLVEMPSELVSIELGDLPRFGFSQGAIAQLRAYLADLPLLPRFSDSRVFVGPASLTTPAMMVLARRVGQAYRSHNISLRDTPAGSQLARLRLAYLRAGTLQSLNRNDWQRALGEAAIFITEALREHVDLLRRLLAERATSNLPTFVGSEARLDPLEAIELT